VPQILKLFLALQGGCRNKSGMTGMARRPFIRSVRPERVEGLFEQTPQTNTPP